MQNETENEDYTGGGGADGAIAGSLWNEGGT
jgi:hypothetical protein